MTLVLRRRGAGETGESRSADAPTPEPPWRRVARPVVAVLPQWVVARGIVGAMLGLAHLVVDRTHPDPATAARVHQGLLGWDAGWYEAIARFGYGALGRQSLRFFPLFPLAGRVVHDLTRAPVGAVLVVLANLATLVATALLFELVRRERGDRALAGRTTWLLSLAPPAFTFVMGYAEGLLLVGTVACFYAMRRGSFSPGRRPAWWWASLFGLAAALTRPLGVVLVLPAAVELVRWWAKSTTAERAGAVAAVVAPLAGVGAFLAYAGVAFGDWWLPIKVQTQSGHHGGLSDPLQTLYHDALGVLHHHVGTALHVPWVVLVVVLVVVCWRLLPASYSVFATGVVLVALSGTNLDSFERYALSAFPLVMVGGLLTASPRVERVVLTLAAAGLAGYALLAFLNISVP